MTSTTLPSSSSLPASVSGCIVSPSRKGTMVHISGSSVCRIGGVTPASAAAMWLRCSRSRSMNVSVPWPGMRITYLPPHGRSARPFTVTT